MGKIFFIADLHFGYKNVMSFDNRPFKDVEDHDDALIRLWNGAVGMDDEVYILGDFSWHNATKTIEIFKQLNGQKHLIRGNHDSKLLRNREVQALFCEITDYKEILVNGDKWLVLCHYPIPCFNHHFYGGYHFYGHVHNSFEWNMMERVKYEMKELYGKPCNMYNVGAMMPWMGYKPRAFEEIICNTFDFDIVPIDDED